MRRNEVVYEHYLACALLLALAECSFFYTDSDTEIGRRVRRLMGMARSGVPDYMRPVDADSESTGASMIIGDTEQDPIRDAVSSVNGESGPRKILTGEKTQLSPIRSFPWTNRFRENPRSRIQEKVMHSGSYGRSGDSWGQVSEPAPAEFSQSIVGQRQGGPRGAQASQSKAPGVSLTKPPYRQTSSFPEMEMAGRRSTGGWRRWLADPDWDGSGRRRMSGKIPPVSFREKRGDPHKGRSAKMCENANGHREHQPRNAPAYHMPFASLRQLLGSGALKPPQGRLEPPDFLHLKNGRSPTLPDGRPLLFVPLRTEAVERLSPPDAIPEYRGWIAQEKSVSNPHWHTAGAVQYLHEGPLWAVPVGNGWAPIIQADKHWWTLADGNQPLIRHQGHWWWKERDTWFLLNRGQPWAYRWFGEWQQSGLINPQTDTRIVYSKDELKAAVITPGKDTILFDLRTGEEIRRWNARRRIFRIP